MADERVTGRRAGTWRPRLCRVLAGLGLLIVLLPVLVWASAAYIDWRGTARPPALVGSPPVLSEAVTESDGVRRIGGSWIARRDGVLRMVLTGEPFSRGYANAALTQSYIREQEESLLGLVRQFIDAKWKLWLVRKLLTWRNRDLPDYVRDEYEMEVYGLSRGYADPFPELGPLYHRLLNYHAAHDIGHALMDNPLVEVPVGACTSFAAFGEATADGHLLVGRNFDFQAGDCFDRNKIVVRVEPDRGFGYIAVGWPGMAGAVSGINDARIAITINAAHSADTRRIGTPVCFVVRSVLQYAATLDEAVDIVRETEVFVADAYLIADGATGRAVVVEKTPTRCAVRRADGHATPSGRRETEREPANRKMVSDTFPSGCLTPFSADPTTVSGRSEGAGPEDGHAILCANHFLTDELTDDPANREYMIQGTSVARYERLQHLVKRASGTLTPRGVVDILRDRHVPGSARPMLGHPAAINPLIATHSVVIDATAGVIWVAAAPHQLGAYVPFSIPGGARDPFDAPTGAEIIPADPILTDGSYERHLAAQRRLAEGKQLLADGDTDDATARLKEAERTNPDLYQAPLLLGRIAFKAGRHEEAEAHFRRALARHPAYKAERDEIARALERIHHLAEKGGAVKREGE